jgi:hypothetical protein
MALVKHPIQIYVDERQNRALRRLAKDKNASISELIRRGIDLLLNQVPVEEDPAYHLIGLVSSGVSDIAENHDEYIVQEIEKEWKR